MKDWYNELLTTLMLLQRVLQDINTITKDEIILEEETEENTQEVSFLKYTFSLSSVVVRQVSLMEEQASIKCCHLINKIFLKLKTFS